ncbi:MAG: elongation factor P [Proteobacteria bacterium]|nr:elongation factor P [Pseudomonadota bacterium]
MKAKDIRKGKVLLFKDAPHSVMDFQHRTPGNLRAFVQAKLRNLITGVQTETRFSSTEDLPEAEVIAYDATYTYSDDNGFHFMNTQNYEEITLSTELMGDNHFYLQDGMVVSINFYNDRPISISLPKTVILSIADTTPDLKGSTASNSPKPATCDTGLNINVPPFIKIGDRVVIDTEEGVYLSRAEQ